MYLDFLNKLQVPKVVELTAVFVKFAKFVKNFLCKSLLNPVCF